MRRIFWQRTLVAGLAITVASAWPSVTAHAVTRRDAVPPETARPRLHTYRQQLGLPEVSAAADGVTLGGPYSFWSWPDNAYHREFRQGITIEPTTTPDAPYFWSYQFISQHGDGGYVGLQDHSNTGTKIALFSVWAADGAQGTNCGTFDGEGEGWTCRIDPYNWVPDREYVVGISIDRSDRRGAWYRGTVTDTVTRTTQTIGRIHVPAGWGLLNGWVSWTEHFGPPAFACADLPRARARFRYPVANGGTVQISHHDQEIGAGDCKSRVTDLTGEVRHTAPK